MNPIDRKRYRRVRWFFLKVTLHVLWWDVILRRPGLQRFRKPQIPRWTQLAREFRALAVELGGVLIKLGQFLSVRVDILPLEVVLELAGLQDEVPPEPLEAVIQQVEADFGRPLSDLFPWFSPDVLGAASLAQTHKAQLPSGEIVVVKVLRPGIQQIVETDLIPIGELVRRLRFYRTIRDTVNLDRLMEEFERVTRQELDFQKEGQHSERFAQYFADDPQVYVPKIYWDYCASQTLTMENVGYIPISDMDKMRAVGINPAQVAQTVSRVYLEQVLLHHFVHADPHSGNLFVKPMPTADELEHDALEHGEKEGALTYGVDDPVPYAADRPYQLVLIDFGMAVEIVERLRTSLRSYLIGVAMGDAHRVIQSYVEGDMVLPHADLDRLEEMTEDLMNKFNDTLLGSAKNVDIFEYNRYFFEEYRELIEHPPLQFQTELLFVLRAMGMIAGLTTQLDPDFDPWIETRPLAQRLLREEAQNNWQDWAKEGLKIGQGLLRMPTRLDELLTLAQREKLTLRTKFSPESRKEIQQLRQSVIRLTWTLAATGLLLCGSLLYVGDRLATALDPTLEPRNLGAWLIVVAISLFIWGMRRRI
ncbi:hypothetical protein KFU94_59975 [Chloroflexi bacterium TSY]|nr:hypothetical protein [Chloroflexi bacterium TSY]